ncbi:hypothetical protein B0H12DRAFT_1114344 [Mycena haematopus]|nr:hypothetical protein B0H12DRAFT_1114344 [Mycena haematopus]
MAAATPTPSTFDAAVATSLAGGSSNSRSPTPPPPQSFAFTSSPNPNTTPTNSSANSPSSTPPPPQSSFTSSPNPTNSPTISSPAAPSASGSTDSQSPSHRNTLPTAATVGIIIALCVTIALATLLLWLRRRRRQNPIQGQDIYTYSAGTGTSIPTPFYDIVSPTLPDTTFVVTEKAEAQNQRRWYLRNELRAAQEQILDIRRSEDAAAGNKNVLRVVTSNVGPQSPDSDVVSALTARIRDLEAQIQSQWELGRLDEAPPGYSKEESRIAP